MFDMYYINCINKKIQFSNDYVVTDASDLFKHKWTYDTKYSKITKYKKEIDNFKVVISVPVNKVDELQEILDKDIKEERKGRFYCGSYYMNCMCTESTLKSYSQLSNRVEIQLIFVAENPQWIKEKKNEFRSGIQTTEGKNYNYPYNYPYNYVNSLLNEVINNENIAPCNFEMTIYGQCSNPSILVGNHYYNVNSVIGTGEYLKINSRTKKIEKHKINGDIESEFDKRNRDYDIFQKIGTGRQPISWSGMFGFDLVLYEERSEPVWI